MRNQKNADSRKKEKKRTKERTLGGTATRNYSYDIVHRLARRQESFLWKYFSSPLLPLLLLLRFLPPRRGTNRRGVKTFTRRESSSRSFLSEYFFVSSVPKLASSSFSASWLLPRRLLRGVTRVRRVSKAINQSNLFVRQKKAFQLQVDCLETVWSSYNDTLVGFLWDLGCFNRRFTGFGLHYTLL